MDFKYIVLIILLFFGHKSISQNLDYNQVILLSTIDTVPQGKVWKIVSVLPSNSLVSTSSNNWSVNSLRISVNGTEIFLAATTNNPGYRTGYSVGNDFLPIWLPSGTILAPATNCNSISIIEFNE